MNRSRQKRIVIAILMLPITVPFVAFWQLIEWFHFQVSNRVLTWCRRNQRRLAAFFDAL